MNADNAWRFEELDENISAYSSASRCLPTPDGLRVIDDARRLINEDKSQVAAWVLLAVAIDQLIPLFSRTEKETAELLDACTQALSLDPGAPVARSVLAGAFWDLRRFDECVEVMGSTDRQRFVDADLEWRWALILEWAFASRVINGYGDGLELIAEELWALKIRDRDELLLASGLDLFAAALRRAAVEGSVRTVGDQDVTEVLAALSDEERAIRDR